MQCLGMAQPVFLTRSNATEDHHPFSEAHKEDSVLHANSCTGKTNCDRLFRFWILSALSSPLGLSFFLKKKKKSFPCVKSSQDV